VTKFSASSRTALDWRASAASSSRFSAALLVVYSADTGDERLRLMRAVSVRFGDRASESEGWAAAGLTNANANAGLSFSSTSSVNPGQVSQLAGERRARDAGRGKRVATEDRASELA
jgi:hypothetical protein